MAEKLYQRINFEGEPSINTPLSEETLNILDKGINDLDDARLNSMPQIISNKNGTAYKFPSGFMICAKEVNEAIAVDISIGNIFQSKEIELGNFAEEFQKTPYVSVTLWTYSDFSSFLGRVRATTSLSAGTVRVLNPVKQSGEYSHKVIVIAFGIAKNA